MQNAVASPCGKQLGCPSKSATDLSHDTAYEIFLYKHKEIENIFTENLMNMHNGIVQNSPACTLVSHIHGFMKMNLDSALE